MKGFDVLKVKSAVKSRNKFDLSRTHLTTADFGEIIPLYNEELIPGDEFHVNASYFSRMAPLTVPTYGKFSFKTVSVFVPYHQLAVDVEAWMAGKTTWEGFTPTTRWFSVKELAEFYKVIGTSVSAAAVATGATYDFIYLFDREEGSKVYYRFEGKARTFVKILNALGYAVPQDVDVYSDSTWCDKVGKNHLSALPLLAYAKAYNDYMSQSSRFNTSSLTILLNKIKYRTSFGDYTPSSGEIKYGVIKSIFDNIYLNYDNDYFISAWQNPNSPLSDVESVLGATVPNNSDEYVGVDTINSYLNEAGGSAGNFVTITQRALDFLRMFDNWVRRNNYSGSRAVQQIYSRFGIKTDDYRSHYAQVLSTDTKPVQVGDITSTADSGDAVLGAYAGKGIMNAGDSVNYKSNDYGLLMILGYFTVVPMNPYGFDRKVLRSDPLDYYNPEFDGLGADAISYGELFTNPLINNNTSASTPTYWDSSVFGFTERYNAYRFGRDQITGDFRNFNFADDPVENQWHTGRDLTSLRENGNLVAQSTAMNTVERENNQFNRMFNITDDTYEDHFYLTCQFNVDAVRPMLNLNQVVNLGEGDTAVPRNGNVIS